MRNVKRLDEPESLTRNADKWTEMLEQQIHERGSYANVAAKYKTRYNQRDVREQLIKMYDDRCCYCESKVSVQSYGRIEHLRPRAKFPEQTYSWDNMHWSCERCNGVKGDSWDEDAPVLDPTRDNICDYITENISTGEYEAVDGNNRGEATIQSAGLNRKELCSARREIKVRLVKLYRQFLCFGDIGGFFSYCEDSISNVPYISTYEKVLSELRQYSKCRT